MMGHRERLKGGTEYDLIFGRHMYCYLSNHSPTHKIKKGMTRRNRRSSKSVLRLSTKSYSV